MALCSCTLLSLCIVDNAWYLRKCFAFFAIWSRPLLCRQTYSSMLPRIGATSLRNPFFALEHKARGGPRFESHQRQTHQKKIVTDNNRRASTIHSLDSTRTHHAFTHRTQRFHYILHTIRRVDRFKQYNRRHPYGLSLPPTPSLTLFLLLGCSPSPARPLGQSPFGSCARRS